MTHEPPFRNPKATSSVYRIQIGGHLSQSWAIRFEGMSIVLAANGTSILTGAVVDQAALLGLLRKVRDLGMPLISVEQLSNTTHHSPVMDQGEHHMNIIIFGATGTTGSEVVKQALEQGYNVTAFVRNPAKVEHNHPNLSMFQGDVLDPTAVEKAITGHDAVLSALGAGRSGTVRSEGTKNIIKAMERLGVRRLISQSSLGVGDSRANLNAFWKYLMFGMLLRKAYADHMLQEQYIRQSSLDWTIVRPGALKEGERTGKYRHGFSVSDRSIILEISVPDTADFIVNQLTDNTYLHATPGLSY